MSESLNLDYLDIVEIQKCNIQFYYLYKDINCLPITFSLICKRLKRGFKISKEDYRFNLTSTMIFKQNLLESLG